jgi:hypothetical protein
MSTNAHRLLVSDLAGAGFRAGELRGDWTLIGAAQEISWPYVFTLVRAAARQNCPEQWLVRWDATNYGSAPLTGGFWDADTASFLAKEKWPRGRQGSVIASVFKIEGWAAPGQGFYHPWDRTALANHSWTDPRWAWKPELTLADYVAQFHRWLNSEDYLGRQAEPHQNALALVA